MANPRRGTRPANALLSLHSLGGAAEIAAWFRVSANGISRVEFDLLVVERLLTSGLVKSDGEMAKLTDVALDYLGVAKQAEVWIGKLPEPRTANAFKPLRARSPMVIRDGAFDYRDIPSVMGAVRVPFRP